jgi:hypothetical protein
VASAPQITGSRRREQNGPSHRSEIDGKAMEVLMADDKTQAGKPDRDRINVGEDYELRDWAKKFGVTPERLKAVVERVGPMAQDVRRELGR